MTSEPTLPARFHNEMGSSIPMWTFCAVGIGTSLLCFGKGDFPWGAITFVVTTSLVLCGRYFVTSNMEISVDQDGITEFKRGKIWRSIRWADVSEIRVERYQVFPEPEMITRYVVDSKYPKEMKSVPFTSKIADGDILMRLVDKLAKSHGIPVTRPPR